MKNYKIKYAITLLMLLTGCAKQKTSKISEGKSAFAGIALLQQILADSTGQENLPNWPHPPRVADIFAHEAISVDTLTIKATMAPLTDKLLRIFALDKILDGGFEIEYQTQIKNRTSVFAIASSKPEYADNVTDSSKNPKGYNNDLFIEASPGVVIANLWDGKRDMVYFCSYSITEEKGENSAWELSLAIPTGALGGYKRWDTKLTDGLESNDMSGFEKIRPGQSLSDLRSICEKRYVSEKHYQSLRRRLKTNTRDMFIYAPKSECLTDVQCKDFNKDYFDSVSKSTIPRCVPIKENVAVCQLFGKEGAACPAYRNITYQDGTKDRFKISSGMFEYPCDKTLKCTITDPGQKLDINISAFDYFAELRLKNAKTACLATDRTAAN